MDICSGVPGDWTLEMVSIDTDRRTEGVVLQSGSSELS